jgi:hypothetical protein
MKFIEPHPFADLDASAELKLIETRTQHYCVFMVPFVLKLFFGLYPESCRFRMYVVWSLLLTPPIDVAGDGVAGTAACAFIAWL